MTLTTIEERENELTKSLSEIRFYISKYIIHPFDPLIELEINIHQILIKGIIYKRIEEDGCSITFNQNEWGENIDGYNLNSDYKNLIKRGILRRRKFLNSLFEAMEKDYKINENEEENSG